MIVEGDSTGKLAFVMHGLGGTKDQPHIRAMIEAFLEAGYTVVSFDTTNSFGESDGNYEDATVTSYYSDLEDVIEWASDQTWYVEPFVLCGHSLGGLSTALYAQKYPEKVKALAPIATVLSGETRLDTYKLFNGQKELDEWKHKGTKTTKSRDGKRTKILKWSHIEDLMRYDLLKKSRLLTMPVILIVGENDTDTLPIHQQMLFNQLTGKKEIHIIKHALHSFYEPQEQAELKQHIISWAKQL